MPINIKGFDLNIFCSEDEYDWEDDLPDKIAEARFVNGALFTLELDPDGYDGDYIITHDGDEVSAQIKGGYDEIIGEFIYVLELYAKEHPASPPIKALL